MISNMSGVSKYVWYLPELNELVTTTNQPESGAEDLMHVLEVEGVVQAIAAYFVGEL